MCSHRWLLIRREIKAYTKKAGLQAEIEEAVGGSRGREVCRYAYTARKRRRSGGDREKGELRESLGVNWTKIRTRGEGLTNLSPLRPLFLHPRHDTAQLPIRSVSTSILPRARACWAALQPFASGSERFWV